MGSMVGDASWLHTIDPFAVHFGGGVGLRWYGVAYVAAFAFAWLALGWLARRRLILVPAHAVGDLVLAVIVGTLVGGRLGYIAFYQPSLLWEFSSSAPWWGVLAINRGGMASHGGMIGIVIACALFARRHRLPVMHIVDCLTFVGPPGAFLGRMANFVNGELLGRVVARPGEAGPWWSVRYPQELLDPGHSPALSAEQEERLTGLLLRVAREGDSYTDAAARLIVRVQSGDAQIAAELAPLLSARHPSQLYQAFAEGVVVMVALLIVWARPRRAGVVTAWFLMVYGAGRVLTEFIRLPDAHLAVQRIAGLSRGQWMSVVMIVAGAAVLWWAVKRPWSEPIGGWLTGRRGREGAAGEAQA